MKGKGKNMQQGGYENLKIEELYQVLQTNEEGLTEEEAKKRIVQYGENTIPQKTKTSILQIFLQELLDPIVLLLFVTIIASLIVGEVADAIVIFIIASIDLIMGVYQENKANQTIEALSKLVPEVVKVKRNQKEVVINSKDITIGDYIFLESGDKVSADIRIIESHNFTVDESVLTGESIAVEKKSQALKEKNLSLTSKNNMVFAGTNVTTGRAKGLVVSIGKNTEIGKIATTINSTKEEKSPLAIRIDQFSKQISIIIIIFSIILTILLINKNMNIQEIMVSVIALAVSIMPEGLPLALTMSLTIASNKMAKRKVVTKKLQSVEALGSCTVIASDKTGTLTVNEQTAKKIILPNDLEYDITGSGYSIVGKVTGDKLEYAKELATLGVINNEAQFTKSEQIGDSIDIAFLVLGEKLNVKINDIEVLETIPYESVNQYSAVFYQKERETYCTVKGSLEVVISLCNSINFTNSFDVAKIIHQNEKLSQNGYRVIAIANGKIKKEETYKEENIKNLTLMGLVGFIDPIRKEAKSAIQKCHQAGIKTLIITGDHPLTAFKIAKDLNLTDNYSEVATGEEVAKYYQKTKEEFDQFIQTKKIYARVTPLEKLNIIESLKRQGEFVAVTGDGVNDAPALKTANIGIAMGSGTDLAKEASKMVVIDDNFNSIVNGVLEGRVAYANIRKIAYFLISCGLAEVFFFTFSILFDLSIPLVAIQLLWLNVVTDGIQDIALSFEKAENKIMNEKPRNPKEGLFDKILKEEIIISGLTMGIMVFALWVYLLKVANMELYVARGYVMAFMIMIQNLHAFNCRSEKTSIFKISIISNPIFLIGIIGSILLGLAIIEVDFLSLFLKTTHIPFLHLMILFCLSLVILVIMEFYKKIKRMSEN